MSWPQWPGIHNQPSIVAAAAAPAAPAPLLNPAPGVIPTGLPYSNDQWSQMQQQNWQQWAQWQQQYQQWHQQYGAEYQKSISALAAVQQPIIPNMALPPPLPTEPQIRPPLPQETVRPPPVQLAPAAPIFNAFSTPPPNFNSQQLEKKHVLPPGGESVAKRQMVNRQGWKNDKNLTAPAPSLPPHSNAPPLPNSDELSEAEKKFDKQFAEWEAQYNKWKEQNSGHPDKQQFKEYEKKWEQWRKQLLDRREAMRKKRMGLLKNYPAKQQNIHFSKPSESSGNDISVQNKKISADKEENKDETLGFLLNSKSDGIPGLDLVKDGAAEGASNEDEQSDSEETENKSKNTGPDLEAISKGINNILSDSKLMSMLSMVTKQNFNFPKRESQSEAIIQNFDDQTRSSFTTNNEPPPPLLQMNIEQPNAISNRDNFANAPKNFNENRNFENFENYKNYEDEEYHDNSGRNRENFARNRNRIGMNYENSYGNGCRNDENGGYSGNYNNYQSGNGRFQGNENVLQRLDSYGSNTMDAPDPPSFHDNMENEEYEHFDNENVSPDNDDDGIWKPEKVVDYNHKSLKKPEVEILVEPFRMFDYRHRLLRRIPYPERPNWLSDSVRMIPEFDPPIIRAPPAIIERRPYEPMLYPRREYEISRYERKVMYERDFSPTPPSLKVRNYEDEQWFIRRNKSRPSPTPEYDANWKKPSSRKDEGTISNWKSDDKKPGSIFPMSKHVEVKKNITYIEDLINPPGRHGRPSRIVIILRGPPGSGKTYLAKIIKDKEVENGGSAPRILSLDDYFMVEQEKEIIEDGKRIKTKVMDYEFEAEMEESYRNSLMKSFKKTITDGFFSFIIVDNVNDKVKYFGEMWSFAKQNGFQVYICQLDLDIQNCTKRNIHSRTEEEIRKCVEGWENTPSHHPLLDVSTFLQGGPISEVEMEEINSSGSDLDDIDDFPEEDRLGRSKWDNFDCSVNNLARLDGVNKPLRPSRTMEEYLQLEEDEWKPTESIKPGQKRVRWADLEERKEQDKMRAIGFVVGHTDWNRMMDPTKGESALTQTKYIEKVEKRKFF